MFLISINSLSDDNKQAAFFSKNYYIKIIYNNQIRVTTTKLKGNNPVWGESFMFNIDIETDNFIVQIIEINSTHEQVILKEYNIKVNYEAMRDCSKDILNFTMGNIYYDVNLKLKKLLYDFKNIKVLVDDKDTQIIRLSGNVRKYKDIISVKNKKLNDILKIINI